MSIHWHVPNQYDGVETYLTQQEAEERVAIINLMEWNFSTQTYSCACQEKRV